MIEGDVEAIQSASGNGQLVLSGVSSRDDKVEGGGIVDSDDISEIDQVVFAVGTSFVSRADSVVDGDGSSEVSGVIGIV